MIFFFNMMRIELVSLNNHKFLDDLLVVSADDQDYMGYESFLPVPRQVRSSAIPILINNNLVFF